MLLFFVILVSGVLSAILGAVSLFYDFTTAFEFVGSLLVIVVLAAAAVWECARKKVFWIFVPRNQIIIISRGEGNPVKYLGFSAWRRQWLNIYWIGLATEVYRFPLTHSRFNAASTKSDDWIEIDEKPEMADHLDRQVTHWARIEVRFSGGQKAKVLVQYNAEFKTPEDADKAVFVLKGKFYPMVDTIIEGETRAYFRSVIYDDFTVQDVSADSAFDKALTPNIAGPSQKTTGLSVTSVFIVRFEDASEVEAELQRLVKEAEIRARAAKLLAEGETADFDLMVRSAKERLPKATDDVIMAEVSRMIVATRQSRPGSHIVAVGGASGVVIDPNAATQGGGKKKRRN